MYGSMPAGGGAQAVTTQGSFPTQTIATQGSVGFGGTTGGYSTIAPSTAIMTTQAEPVPTAMTGIVPGGYGAGYSTMAPSGATYMTQPSQGLTTTVYSSGGQMPMEPVATAMPMTTTMSTGVAYPMSSYSIPAMSSAMPMMSSVAVPGTMVVSGGGVMMPGAGSMAMMGAAPGGMAMYSGGMLKAGSITDDVFNMVDRNQDGVISRSEFRGALKGNIIAASQLTRSRLGR